MAKAKNNEDLVILAMHAFSLVVKRLYDMKILSTKPLFSLKLSAES